MTQPRIDFDAAPEPPSSLTTSPSAIQARRSGRQRVAVAKPLVVDDVDSERFSKFIDRVEQNDCWIWKGSKNKAGYGTFSVKGKMYRAHRVAIALDGRPASIYEDVMHICDNPSCVNPSHLRSGPTRDNILDMERKGRACHPRGEENGRARFTEEQVREMRRLRASGVMTKDLSVIYQCDGSFIRAIVRKKIWRHVD